MLTHNMLYLNNLLLAAQHCITTFTTLVTYITYRIVHITIHYFVMIVLVVAWIIIT